MTTYNRYTVSVLATVDSADSGETQRLIKEALNALPKVRVKTISFDLWVNGMTGEDRVFDEDGKEIFSNATVTAEASTTSVPEVEAEEVKA